MTTWRMQLAIRSAPLGVVLIGAVILGGCGGQADMPSARAVAPSASAVAHAYAGTHAAPTPTATVAPTAPPLTGSFTSSIHGISLSYPAGWSTKPATEPWTTEGRPDFPDPNVDVIHDPVEVDSLFVGVASQPLAGKTDDQWAADLLAGEDCGPTEPVTIDGAAGLLGECLFATVTIDGRGYFVWLYTPTTNEGLLFAPYDRAWFEQLLATVDLRPEDAIDAVPLTQTFTSQMHGISVRLPEGWTAQAATEPWTDGPNSHSILDPHDDRLLHPTLTDHLFLSISSQPIGDSTPQAWIAEQMRGMGGLGGMHGNRADRRRRGVRTDRVRGLRPRRRHNRRPRLLDLAPRVQGRSIRGRSLRQGVVRGGPCHRATASRGRRRLRAVALTVACP